MHPECLHFVQENTDEVVARQMNNDVEKIATLKQQRDDLLAAIKQTLDANRHLADGDVCTLKVLKDAYNSVSDVKWD